MSYVVCHLDGGGRRRGYDGDDDVEGSLQHAPEESRHVQRMFDDVYD
jgi:hypothetical protein